MSPRSNRKPALGQRSTSKNTWPWWVVDSSHAIWSRDTGQQIPYFERCQLLITWMSNIKEVHGKPRLHVFCQPVIWNLAVNPYPRTEPKKMFHQPAQFPSLCTQGHLIVWLKKVESNVKLYFVRSTPAESSEAKIPTYCRVHQYLRVVRWAPIF